MSMLAELIAAGTPAPIRTQYPTRQHPDCIHPRKQVQCPRCHDWSDLTHNSFCTGCLIKLAYIEVEQPAPATVATPEPVAEEAAALVEVATGQEEVPATTEPQPRPVVLHSEYYTVVSGQYELTCQSKNALAVDCTCPSRVKRGRLVGKACKHMMAHNATLKLVAA